MIHDLPLQVDKGASSLKLEEKVVVEDRLSLLLTVMALSIQTLRDLQR